MDESLPDILPRKRNGITVVDYGSEKVLYDEALGKVHVLNPVGFRIWNACDGKTESSSILKQLHEDFPSADCDSIERDLRAYICTLTEKSLFDLPSG